MKYSISNKLQKTKNSRFSPSGEKQFILLCTRCTRAIYSALIRRFTTFGFWLSWNKRIFLREFLIRISTFDYFIIKRIIKKEFAPFDKEKILDLGSGTGILSSLFPKNKYLGVDIDPKLVKFARKKYKRNFKIMDISRLKLPPSSFDKILIVGVIHHLDDETFNKACRQMKKVAKKNGNILVIEAIEPKSQYNIFGKILRYFDQGEYIRNLKGYKNILARHFKILKSYNQSGGLFDYGVFYLSNSEVE